MPTPGEGDYFIPIPVIDGIADDTGISDTDRLTNDANIIFTGSATTTASQVEIFVNGLSVGTTTVDGFGDWIFDYSAVTLTDATYDIQAVSTVSGVISQISAPLSIVVDTTPPTPLVSNPLAGTTYATTTLPIIGVCEENQSVSVATSPSSGFAPHPVTTVTDGAGIFSVNPVWADGVYDVIVSCTDTAGNVGTTDITDITIDTMAPGVPVIRTINQDTGLSMVDGVTNDNSVTFLGDSDASSILEIFINETLVGTTTSDGLGNWVFDYSGTLLPDAEYSITVKSFDGAGNESATSSAYVLIVDTSPSVITINSPLDSATLSDATPLVSGSGAEIGASVTVSGALGEGCVTTVDASGDWNCEITPALTSDGLQDINIEVIDIAGNIATTTISNLRINTPSSEVRSNGSSRTKRTCRDPEASNYKQFGKHNQKICKYEKKDTEVEKSEIIENSSQEISLKSVCTPYLTKTIRLGENNDKDEVKKLQRFLNENQGEKLIVDGIYNQDDYDAVKRFQIKYRSEILDIWGLSEPTGFVYVTTRSKINSFYCNKDITCPLFTEYNSKLINTSSAEVQTTKILLTELGFYNGVINQDYDNSIFEAIKKFQETFKETMLTPWGLTAGTGYKFKTTNRFLNNLVGCKLPPEKLENGVTVSY